MLLRSITHGHLEDFKQVLFSTPTQHKTPKARSIASVNRALSLLRRIFSVGVQQRWLDRNPFGTGNALINAADERKRERILTRDEEQRLLSVCVGKRKHLRPILICALDTGMRRNEILKTCWNDVDFINHIITTRSYKGRALQLREVGISDRLYTELLVLYESSDKKADSLCFGTHADIKTGFNNAKKAAGLEGVRLHDLRHTHASRLAEANVPISTISRLLGHTQIATTMRYINTDRQTVLGVTDIINRINLTTSASDHLTGPVN
jgi:integrase